MLHSRVLQAGHEKYTGKPTYVQKMLEDWPQYSLAKSIFVLIFFYLLITLVFYVLLPRFFEQAYLQTKPQALVMVMGDLGHSPRMLYHAKNLSKKYHVKLFGYLQSNLPSYIIDNPDITVVEIPVQRAGGLVGMLKKVLVQHVTLWKLLSKDVQYSKYILIQNPPVLPLLHIVVLWLCFYSQNSKIILDWHNLNYSLLQLKLGPGLVYRAAGYIMKKYEFYLSRFCWLNLTVSENMKQFLNVSIYKGHGSTKFINLYDRPADQFKPIVDRQAAISKFPEIFPEIDLTKDKILLSSTSFTLDEDFNILLDALKSYDQEVDLKQLPKVYLIVTGKGPEQDNFHRRIKELKFSKNIIIKNHWFSNEEYTQVIGVADLAISLHLSSSGIDLPMKILDFFGVGVPTISVNFETISELVKPGINGFILENNSLQCLKDTIINVVTDDKVYQKIKAGAMKESLNTWDTNWERNLGIYL